MSSARERARRAVPKVDFVEWNGEKHFVRALSGTDRAKYTALVQETKDSGGVPLETIVAFGLCEEDGTLAYDRTKPEDLAELGDRDGGFLEAIALKLFDISGLSNKAVEDAGKN